VIGFSTYYTRLLSQGGVSSRTSFSTLRSAAGPLPESKLLMFGPPFTAGAVRVQFKVDTRNQRQPGYRASLALSGKVSLLGPSYPGPVYIRDTVRVSVLDHDGRSEGSTPELVESLIEADRHKLLMPESR